MKNSLGGGRRTDRPTGFAACDAPRCPAMRTIGGDDATRAKTRFSRRLNFRVFQQYRREAVIADRVRGRDSWPGRRRSRATLEARCPPIGEVPVRLLIGCPRRKSEVPAEGLRRMSATTQATGGRPRRVSLGCVVWRGHCAVDSKVCGMAFLLDVRCRA